MDNFIVSARKYRPTTFDSVIGQGSITNTLKNAIKNNHLAQAFLFCGPRGVGKTTCARILAKTINCENVSENLEACDTCESCTSFNQSHSFNIHELDAASHNSVDDIRSLIEQVRIAPQVGNYSIYIIDEVHMLSVAAFNAFLKTLEEPPSYAVFILATTSKQKIIPTILSRCQIFDFSRIQVEDIALHLGSIAAEQGVDAEPDGLHIIAQKADGSLRDALSIFDQMVSFGGKEISYIDVIENLNILDYDYYFKAINAILERNISDSLLLFNEVLSNGFDGHNYITGLSEHVRNLLVCKDEATLGLLQVGERIKKRYLEQSQSCSAELLLDALTMANKCDISYNTSINKRLHVELLLMQLCSVDGIKENEGPKVKIIPPAAVSDKAVATEEKSAKLDESTVVEAKVEEPQEEYNKEESVAQETESEVETPTVEEKQVSKEETVEEIASPVIETPVTDESTDASIESTEEEAPEEVEAPAMEAQTPAVEEEPASKEEPVEEIASPVIETPVTDESTDASIESTEEEAPGEVEALAMEAQTPAVEEEPTSKEEPVEEIASPAIETPVSDASTDVSIETTEEKVPTEIEAPAMEAQTPIVEEEPTSKEEPVEEIASPAIETPVTDESTDVSIETTEEETPAEVEAPAMEAQTPTVEEGPASKEEPVEEIAAPVIETPITDESTETSIETTKEEAPAEAEAPEEYKLQTKSLLDFVQASGETEKKNDGEPAETYAGAQVTQEKFDEVWNRYAEQVKAEGKHSLYSTLTKRKPVLGENYVITLEIDNSVQDSELNEEGASLHEFLRKELDNGELSLEVNILKIQEDRKPYTSMEKFKRMAEKNPSIEKFRKQLNLDID